MRKKKHTKYCNTCGTHKEVAEFSKNSKTYDGFQSACKACNKAYMAANKKKYQEYQKEYCKNPSVRKKKRETSSNYQKKNQKLLRALALIRYHAKRGRKFNF